MDRKKRCIVVRSARSTPKRPLDDGWVAPRLTDPPKMLKVLVAEDHSQLRRSLCRILAGQMEVVGTAVDGPDVYEKAIRLRPDVILMDFRMPLMNGVEATREIRSKWPHVRVVAHSAFADAATVEAMLDAGAVRFIQKGSSAIRRLAHDLSYPRCIPGCGSCAELRLAASKEGTPVN